MWLANRETGMLPIITLTAALIFFVLWRTGVLDDLCRSAPGRGVARWKIEKPRAKPAKSPPPGRKDRLEVFQKFIENLPDDDEKKPDS
jgi:hypothetical protein